MEAFANTLRVKRGRLKATHISIILVGAANSRPAGKKNDSLKKVIYTLYLKYAKLTKKFIK